MLDNNTLEGILISSLRTNIYLTKDGTELNLSMNVRIVDEDTDVAFTDATNLQNILTNVVKEVVNDYAADGQEVD